jgi:hypothetical protein
MPPGPFSSPPELYDGKTPDWVVWDEARQWWFCKPCRKFTDDNHIRTDTHVKNLLWHDDCKQYQKDHKLYSVCNKPPPPPPPGTTLVLWQKTPPPPPSRTYAVDVYDNGAAAAAAAAADADDKQDLVDRVAVLESRLDEIDRAFDNFVDRFFKLSARLDQVIELVEGAAAGRSSSTTAEDRGGPWK